jgi:hypothetical protein
MVAAPKPYETFGGWRPSVLAQFPALGGWRETGGGLVVPKRTLFNTNTVTNSIPATSTATVNFTFGASANPGNQGVNVPPLDTLNPNDAILFEQLALNIGAASVAGALTVVGAIFLLSRIGTTLFIIPITPPTLNLIPPIGANTYSLSSQWVFGAGEMQEMGAQAAVPGGPPFNDWQLIMQIAVQNTNAAAQTFNTRCAMAYRRFQGVSPS